MKIFRKGIGINCSRIHLSVLFVILFVNLFGLGACSSIPLEAATPDLTATPSPTPDASMQEERVYAALVADLYASSTLLVIMDRTQTSVLGLADTATYHHVGANLKTLTNETMQDFKSNNDASHSLRASMVLGVKYILFSQKDRQELFKINQSGWDVFYNRYPDAPGIITFSRVGFNKTMEQALVYLGIQSNWLAGFGNFYLLEKINGSWVIKEQVMSWIS